MKRVTNISNRSFLAGLTFAFLASGPLVAQVPPTANLYLNSAGSYTVLAGIYTSPYTAQLTPGTTYSSSSATVPVICDDWASDSYIDEDWNAYQTTLSGLTSGSSPDTYVKWGDSGTVTVNDIAEGGTLNATLTQVEAYDAAALLSIAILNSSPTGGVQQQDYSYALWALFDPSDALGWLQMFDGGSPVQAAAETTAMADLNTAVQTVLANPAGVSSYLLSNYNVTIYSYPYPTGSGTGPLDPNGPTGCGSYCAPPPQEFITVSDAPVVTTTHAGPDPVPEASSASVFGVYLLLGGTSFFVLGRRRVKADRV